MGKIRKPENAKLCVGIIAVSKDIAGQALEQFSKGFGAIDHRSREIDFKFTEYYKEEMGSGLIRFWVSFERLIDPSKLAEAKTLSNKIEEYFVESGKRKVNIDPGYITPAKVVLASTKDFSHRIYLRNGVYAEVTLIYRHKKFIPLEWSYPDYQSETAYEFLYKIRDIHQERLKKETVEADNI